MFPLSASISLAFSIGAKRIPWPNLVPAWDVCLGIAGLVPAQRFHGTGRRKHSVVAAPAGVIKTVALSSVTAFDPLWGRFL